MQIVNQIADFLWLLMTVALFVFVAAVTVAFVRSRWAESQVVFAEREDVTLSVNHVTVRWGRGCMEENFLKGLTLVVELVSSGGKTASFETKGVGGQMWRLLADIPSFDLDEVSRQRTREAFWRVCPGRSVPDDLWLEIRRAIKAARPTNERPGSYGYLPRFGG